MTIGAFVSLHYYYFYYYYYYYYFFAFNELLRQTLYLLWQTFLS